MAILTEINGPIYNTVDQYPEGTYCLIEASRTGTVQKYLGSKVDEKGFTVSLYSDPIPRIEAGQPYMQQKTYEGCVISTGEKNGYHDSDFYADVWNDEKGCIHRVEYATTRFPTYGNSATPDLTPENAAKVKAWQEKDRARQRAEKELHDWNIPDKGKTVKVIAGRKLPVGTIGEVFWYGRDSFKGRYADKYDNGLRTEHFGVWDTTAYREKMYHRVGIKLQDGTKVFLDALNVEVLPREQVAA